MGTKYAVPGKNDRPLRALNALLTRPMHRLELYNQFFAMSPISRRELHEAVRVDLA